MHLFERDCVTCPTNLPTNDCNCKSSESCILTLQTCSSCAAYICRSNGGSHAGAIAGGVVGGLAAIALAIGIYFWSRYLKRRREGNLNEPYSPDMDLGDKLDAAERRGLNTRSITSVNTTQARGSNIIPIAYIPGVTVLPKSTQQASDDHVIRDSIATSNYRASLPDFVMAIHGQPSLVEVGDKGQGRNRTSGNSGLSGISEASDSDAETAFPERGSSRMGPRATSQYSNDLSTLSEESADFNEKMEGAFYSLDSAGNRQNPVPNTNLSNPGFPQDTTDASANSGKSMVTIPEDPQESRYGSARVGFQIPRNAGGATSQNPVAARASSRVMSTRVPSSYSQIGDRASRYSRASSTKEYMLNLPEEAYLYHGAGHDEDEEA